MRLRWLLPLLLLLTTPTHAQVGASGLGFIGKRGLTVSAVSVPSTPMIQPIMANMNLPSSGTTASEFIAAIGQVGITTGSTHAIPIPMSAIIEGFNTELSASNTGVSVVDTINGTDGTVGCTISVQTCGTFNSNTDSVNAGDVVQFHWKSNGNTWAQPASSAGPQQNSFLLASNNAQGALLAYITTISSTGVWLGPGGPGFSTTTELVASSIMPVSGMINSLFMYTNGAENTSPHAATLWHNGSSTALTCTSAPSGNGCCITPAGGESLAGSATICSSGATQISFSAGDTISIDVTCPGGSCATINPGVSVAYTPTIAGQGILNTSFQASVTTSYVAPYDNHVLTTQINPQLTPQLGSRTLTFNNLIVCSNTDPGASGSRTVTSQSAPLATPPPTNVASGTTVNIVHLTTCPGANSTPLPAGNIDTGHPWTAASSVLLDDAFTQTGTPTSGSLIWKLGKTAVVQ